MKSDQRSNNFISVVDIDKDQISLTSSIANPVINLQSSIGISRSQASFRPSNPPSQNVNQDFYPTMPESFSLNFPNSEHQFYFRGSLNGSMARSQVGTNKEDSLPRTRRTSIPQTVCLNSKTKEVIEPFSTVVGEEVPEDKDMVQRINRLLIEGQWGYSSLFGRDNTRKIQCEFIGDRTERDKDFPSVLGLVSPKMRQNYKIYGSGCMHLVNSKQPVSLVHKSLPFGVTPTNSRYFIYGLFALSKNLQPILLGLGFAKDQAIENHLDKVYYYILKAFIDSHNQELTEERTQMEARKKLLGRGGRRIELVSEKSYVFPDILFCDTSRQMLEASEKIKQEYGIRFDLHHNYDQRFQAINKKFLRHELKKQANIKNRGEIVIRKMLETNNANDIAVSITELDTHNLDFARRYKCFGLDKYCLINFEKRFVGFNVFHRYQVPMVNYISNIVVGTSNRIFKDFLESVLKQEEIDEKKPAQNFQDKYGILKYVPRLRLLLPRVEPKVMTQILDVYMVGKKLHIEKGESSTADNPKYVVGKGKRHKRAVVEYKHQRWKCECGYQAKIGIPCVHLMCVLHTEKREKYVNYISPKLLKESKEDEIYIQE